MGPGAEPEAAEASEARPTARYPNRFSSSSYFSWVIKAS